MLLPILLMLLFQLPLLPQLLLWLQTLSLRLLLHPFLLALLLLLLPLPPIGG